MSESAPQAASTVPSAVHPQTLQTLRLARASQAFLATLERPPELWEAFTLAHAHSMFLRCWLELRIRRIESEAAGEAEKAVVQKIVDLRRENGPWMAGLRVFLADLPQVSPPGEMHEIVLALMANTAKARETALRWISDPTGSRSAATEEMRGMLQLAHAYQRAIGSGTVRREKTPDRAAEPGAKKEDRPAEPPPEDPHSPITRILPRGVKMQTLEDVGRVDDCRRILKEFDPEVQLWECFCLVMTDEASRRSIDDLVRRKKAAPAQTFAQDAQSLFDRLHEIRKEHAPFVRSLAAFLGELPVGHYATETREMALGFIVAGQVGREHAALWLADPAHYRQEAATRFEGLIGRAMNYQTALRAFAES
ncbi:MAG TPA: hypothetical protein VKU80_13280 [Planctomycetota bacterium]|nr:hypothetical protein [Planctomycetota bacterium]